MYLHWNFISRVIAMSLPFLRHFFVQIEVRMPREFILEISSLRKIGTRELSRALTATGISTINIYVENMY
jgi:hypothetical protein